VLEKHAVLHPRRKEFPVTCTDVLARFRKPPTVIKESALSQNHLRFRIRPEIPIRSTIQTVAESSEEAAAKIFAFMLQKCFSCDQNRCQSGLSAVRVLGLAPGTSSRPRGKKIENEGTTGALFLERNALCVPFCSLKFLSMSLIPQMLSRMAWKRSSVRSRSGPPIKPTT
jgi:hypothetical protein